MCLVTAPSEMLTPVTAPTIRAAAATFDELPMRTAHVGAQTLGGRFGAQLVGGADSP